MMKTTTILATKPLLLFMVMLMMASCTPLVLARASPKAALGDCHPQNLFPIAGVKAAESCLISSTTPGRHGTCQLPQGYYTAHGEASCHVNITVAECEACLRRAFADANCRPDVNIDVVTAAANLSSCAVSYKLYVSI